MTKQCEPWAQKPPPSLGTHSRKEQGWCETSLSGPLQFKSQLCSRKYFCWRIAKIAQITPSEFSETSEVVNCIWMCYQGIGYQAWRDPCIFFLWLKTISVHFKVWMMSLSYTLHLKVRKTYKSLSQEGMSCWGEDVCPVWKRWPSLSMALLLPSTPSVICGIQWRASYSFDDIAINCPCSFIWYRSWKTVVLTKDTKMDREVVICEKALFFFFLILAWCSFGLLEQVAFKEKRVAF